MTRTPTLIAALQANDADPALFHQIAAEIDLALDRLHSSRNASQREGDNLYFFDRDALRVGLAWVPQASDTAPDETAESAASADDCETLPAPANRACIICAVGAHTAEGQRQLRPVESGPIAHAVVDHVSESLTSDLVLWHSARRVLDTELMDLVASTLTDHGPIDVKTRDKTPRPLPVLTGSTARHEADKKAPTPSYEEQAEMARIVAAASSRPEPEVMTELRGIITSPDPQPSANWSLRAALMAWSYTFLIIQPPVGASMLTYMTLRSAFADVRAESSGEAATA